ncbi:lipoprotein insertase outer membrane protein LolB [Legionella maioricensis]|uniref:Outer-membrane lipoprotein LolB n=1 Tax=Legionella maioricensis TaxID=2896528 RepID=A0A9X2ID82_9GAMM|nr:lipoprotein insertase outer membrane protein LolB [Legionella maioricensis]MCL9685267.1 lipoprotein insertase outer membrane protein LolB [Legionella maioricensis]MCL9688484.1 lipoprotein insertase outer membrane protein LolB [Legionella maioricensis]
MNTTKHLGILSFCLLTACAPPPQPAEELPTNKVIPLEKRKSETATISSWQIQGAMAAKNKAKGWSATMNWVQHGPSSYQIRLMGPLGGGTVVINKNGSVITFKDGAKTSTSTNADELLLKQTGIRLPVNNLYYWVRGLPAPGGVQSEQHDKYNHLVQLKQNGYTINFTKYTSVKGIDLPSMIRLDGNGVMVKVVIKNWTV